MERTKQHGCILFKNLFKYTVLELILPLGQL